MGQRETEHERGRGRESGETETEHEQGRSRERDTESETGSRLRAVSTEPDTGLELTNCEIVT